MEAKHDNPTWIEAIDACRPTHDDLAFVEMAELSERVNDEAPVREAYQRSQRLDLAIGQAFQDVEVPPGLAERLLLGLAEPREDVDVAPAKDGQFSATPAAVDSATPAAADDVPRPAEQGAARWYRRMILGGAVAATLVVGLFAAVSYFFKDPPISSSQVQNAALRWVDDLPDSAWQQDVQSRLSSHPLPPALATTATERTRQWQSYETEFGQAVVYDLTPPGKGFVFVFVVPTRAEFQGIGSDFLSQQPDSTTRNRCLGFAWHKAKGLLYVLVVEGQDVSRYRSLFNQHPFT